MLTFKRLISFIVPSSILGLSWFWWKWKNKMSLKAVDMDSICETTRSISINSEQKDSLETEEAVECCSDNDMPSIKKSFCTDVKFNENKDLVIEDEVSVLVIDEQLVNPCTDEITEGKVTELNHPRRDYKHVEGNLDADKQAGYDIKADVENNLNITLVSQPECGNGILEMNPISQLSVDCVQEDSVCEEFSPVQYNTSPGKRIRNQSSCGDSAIGDDYSSDALSITGSDSAIKSSESEACTTDGQPLHEEQCLKKSLFQQENGRTYRDWYGSSICSTDFKERPDKPRHWGSLPVSDTDSDSECILKRTSKIGSVSLDKLSIQLNEELSKMKSPVEKTTSSKSNRYPRQSRRRNRKSESRTPKKTPVSKPSPQPKKNESSRRQRRKSNCGSPKKDIDKPWRNQESCKKSEKSVVEENAKRVTVEYEFPDDMCGRLIGKSGRHISEFKESSGVDICIECELHGKNRIVSMTGVLSQIQNAEKQLNEKFHDSLKLVNYPDISDAEREISVVTLPENTEFNVVVTAIIDVANFYVQLCNRDVEERLMQLQTDMYGCYLNPRQKYIYKDKDLPDVDEYCVSFIDNLWCRLKVLEVNPESRMIDAFFIDYGGNVNLSVEFVWKIRPDLLQIPAQAVLCCLNNAIPVVGATDFSYEANELFYQLVGAKALQAYVSSIRDNMPYVQLSYFDEERGEMFSVLEQMQLWGLVQDESIPTQFRDSPHDESTQGDPSREENTIEYVRPLQEDSTQFVESILNCSAPQFICAS